MSIECLKCGEPLKPEMEECPKCGSRDRHVTVRESLTLLENFTLPDLTQDTINAYKMVSETLSTAQSYYKEATRRIDIATARGTISPTDAKGIQQVLMKWYDLSKQWDQRVKEATAKGDGTKLLDTDREMKEKLPILIKEIHDEIVGYKPVWNEIRGLFGVQSSNEKETAVFRDMSHERLLNDFRKWLEKRNTERKIFGNIIHGPREAGIDIIAEISSEPRIKIGVQIKDNDDIKKKDFPKKVKAQITNSKKHDLKGLIIVFCGDLTDNRKPRVKDRVRGMISDLSQVKNRIIAIPPEKALTILREVDPIHAIPR